VDAPALTIGNGWARPTPARKAHFFRGDESLCSKYWYTGIRWRKNRSVAQERCVVCEYLVDLAERTRAEGPGARA